MTAATRPCTRYSAPILAAATDVPVPEGALSYSSSAVNLSGWYDYLNELSLTVPELGGDLDSLVLSLTGLNLRESVFSWTGEQLVIRDDRTQRSCRTGGTERKPFG